MFKFSISFLGRFWIHQHVFTGDKKFLCIIIYLNALFKKMHIAGLKQGNCLSPVDVRPKYFLHVTQIKVQSHTGTHGSIISPSLTVLWSPAHLKRKKVLHLKRTFCQSKQLTCDGSTILRRGWQVKCEENWTMLLYLWVCESCMPTWRWKLAISDRSRVSFRRNAAQFRKLCSGRESSTHCEFWKHMPIDRTLTN